jgi:aryl-alcohol dehydrogenase-like predicted oxidoreductase
MERKTLGRTGLAVSRLGLGLAALGRPGYINLGHAADLHDDYNIQAMEAQAHTVLDAARQAGVCYFDAARSYGRAEAFLASWFRSRNVSPGEVTVSSKWGYTYTAGWRVAADRHEVKDHSLATLRRQLGESRELLGEYLGLYQIHSATRESGVLEDRAVLEALARLRATGVKIGLTLSGPIQAETLRRALEVTVEGQQLFDCVQATWNLLEPSAGPALTMAHQAGLSVVVKEALANGRLTTRNDDPAFAEKRRLLEEVATRLGTTLDALALAAVLTQPWADAVLSGAMTREQLRSNLAALGMAWDEEAGRAQDSLQTRDRDTAGPGHPRGRITWRAERSWRSAPTTTTACSASPACCSGRPASTTESLSSRSLVTTPTGRPSRAGRRSSWRGPSASVKNMGRTCAT